MKFVRYRHTIEHMYELAHGRKFIFYCDQGMLNYMYPDFEAMGVNIAYIVSDSLDIDTYEGKEVRKSIDLFYENPEDVFVFVSLLSGHAEAYRNMVNMGFRYGSGIGSDFYIGAGSGGFEDIDVLDSLLGINRYYGNVLGFKIFGDPEDAEVKIMIFGGSTSDPTVGWNVSWSEALYNLLLQKKVCIYNGAIIGNIAIQMFQKFIRDGISYKPDIVITFDGLNDRAGGTGDVEYPFLQKYQRRLFDHMQSMRGFAPDTLGVRNLNRMVYGISSEDVPDYERYEKVHRWFHAVCEEYGIEYYGFFQPTLDTGKYLLDEREKVFKHDIDADVAVEISTYGSESAKPFYEHLKPFLEEKDYMFDLTDIFDGKQHMYYDFYHSTDEGNQVIAEHIYKHIWGE